MLEHEKRIIEAFALRNHRFREAAIAAHRRECRVTGKARGTPHQDFMAEVDNPVPDLYLRNQYRVTLLQSIANKDEVVRQADEWVRVKGD